VKIFQIVFYVPDEHLEKVKSAMFAAGGGRIGNYDHCCWQTMGQGQFRPLPGSHPSIGSLGKMEVLDEWKVEMACAADKKDLVVKALKESHPYETPAFFVFESLAPSP
jgi:hypothetical protein